MLPVEGGWSAILRLPDLDRDGSAWATHLYEHTGLKVQPGALHGLEGPFVVVSLLSPPSTMSRAAARLRHELEG